MVISISSDDLTNMTSGQGKYKKRSGKTRKGVKNEMKNKLRQRHALLPTSIPSVDLTYMTSGKRKGKIKQRKDENRS